MPIVTNREQPVEVDRPVDREQVCLAEVEMVQKKIAKILWTSMTDFETDGRAKSAGLELPFECANEIFDLLVVNIEVTVASDPKLVATRNVHARKQIGDMRMNH